MQVWAWNRSGELVDSCTVPITSPTPTPQDVSGEILYQGNVFSVIQTKSEIIVKNTSTFRVAIRISWDKNDPGGIGKGKDSYLHNNVTPNMTVKQEFKEHTSVQIWAWDGAGKLVDSCDVKIK